MSEALRGGVLRVATAGSVDDGKSTLIGRLLHDTRNVLADQLDAAARASRRRGMVDTDLALLVDGLRAEREQGITIDVAYRYFATARRAFILADSPGHVQYTRNMVSAASNADVAIVLVDAGKGVVEQTRRHAAVAAVLRVPHIVLAVNKMDLVDGAESVFDDIARDFAMLADRLGLASVTTIPMSALRGDNIVSRGTGMAWYEGPTLLEHLEDFVPPEPEPCGLRVPVQHVLLSEVDCHTYVGRVAAGVLRVGQQVVALPSGQVSEVSAIYSYSQSLGTATAGRSVAARLADALPLRRGDLLATDPPAPARELTATVCWLSSDPIGPGDRVVIRAGTREVPATVTGVGGALDLNDLRFVDAPTIRAMDLGRLTLTTDEHVYVDRYVDSRRTGSFLLQAPDSGATVGAGMVEWTAGRP